MSTSQPNTPSDASTPGAAQSQEGIVFRRRSRGINPFTTSVSQEIARQALQQEATADSDEESLKKPPPRDVPSPAAPTHAAPAPQPTSLARESTKEQHQRSSSSVPDFIGPSRSLNTSFEEYRQRGNGSPDNVVGTLAKQVRDRHGARNATGAIFKRGQKAAAGLAVVSSILGGSVLGAMVDPSQTIFDLKTYKSGTETCMVHSFSLCDGRHA